MVCGIGWGLSFRNKIEVEFLELGYSSKSDDVEIGEIMVRPKFNFDIKREYLNSPDESKKVFLSSGWYVVFER